MLFCQRLSFLRWAESTTLFDEMVARATSQMTSFRKSCRWSSLHPEQRILILVADAR